MKAFTFEISNLGKNCIEIKLNLSSKNVDFGSKTNEIGDSHASKNFSKRERGARNFSILCLPSFRQDTMLLDMIQNKNLKKFLKIT